MACITALRFPAAMATTQLACDVVRHEKDVFAWTPNDRSPLRMSWTVTTDDWGHRKLQLQWIPSHS